jgi:hypothetical protein
MPEPKAPTVEEPENKPAQGLWRFGDIVRLQNMQTYVIVQHVDADFYIAFEQQYMTGRYGDMKLRQGAVSLFLIEVNHV